jgi:hypothetical protein
MNLSNDMTIRVSVFGMKVSNEMAIRGGVFG